MTKPEKDSGPPPGGDSPEIVSSPRTAAQHPVQGVPSLLPRVTPPQPAEPYRMSDLPEFHRQPDHRRPRRRAAGRSLGTSTRTGTPGSAARAPTAWCTSCSSARSPRAWSLTTSSSEGCIWRCCCSPGHLEPVTPASQHPPREQPAAVNARKDRCDNGHEFDLFTTYWYVGKDGHERRDCRICIRYRVAKYKRIPAPSRQPGSGAASASALPRPPRRTRSRCSPPKSGGRVSPAVTSGRLWLAGRAVLAVQENGALRDADLREPSWPAIRRTCGRPSRS